MCYALSMEIKIYTQELENVAKAFRDKGVGGFPRAVQWATALTLTKSAYKTYRVVQQRLQMQFVIRNRGILKSMVGYRMAKGSRPITAQESRVFTKQKDRFTGWIEHEDGGRDKRKRLFSDEARSGGSHNRQVKKNRRALSTRKIIKTQDFVDRTNINSTLAALTYITYRMSKGENPDDLIEVGKGHPSAKPGIYKYTAKGDKLEYIASTPKTQRVVRRKPFMMVSAKQALSGPEPEKWFLREMDKQLRHRVRKLKVTR